MMPMLPAQIVELPQEFFLFIAQLYRCQHLKFYHHIPAIPATQTGNSFMTQGKHGPGLTACRDLQILFTMDRRHLNLATKGSLNHGHREAAINGFPFPFKKLMFLDMNNHIEITGRPAATPAFTFSAQAHPGAMINTARNLDRDLLALIHQSGPIAVGTRIGDNLTLTMALRAGRTDLEKSLGADQVGQVSLL